MCPQRVLDFSLTPCCVTFDREYTFCNVWAGNFGTIARTHKSEHIFVWGLNASGQLGLYHECRTTPYTVQVLNVQVQLHVRHYPVQVLDIKHELHPRLLQLSLFKFKCFSRCSIKFSISTKPSEINRTTLCTSLNALARSSTNTAKVLTFFHLLVYLCSPEMEHRAILDF